MQLFRNEAMRGQDRLHGDVSLVPPVSWQLLGGFLLSSTAAAAAFAAFAGYGSVTVVDGTLSGDLGMMRIAPARPGTVEAVLVHDGQRVARGAPLARISLETADAAGSLGGRRIDALRDRQEALSRRTPELAGIAEDRIRSLRAQISGDRADLSSLADQITEQRELVRTATEDLERVREVAKRGFISLRDQRAREEQLAGRRQALSRLEQDVSNRRSRIGMAEADVARARRDLSVQMSEIQAQTAELRGEAASDDNARTIVVTSPGGGTVTGVTAHAGDPASPSTPMMTVVPEGTRLQATLEIPAAKAGLIERGQTMRISVDAFPQQIFGTIDARLESISEAALPITHPDGSRTDAFLVTASLAKDSMQAYGTPRRLSPGMTVKARIATRPRTLLQWIFDPILAVSKR